MHTLQRDGPEHQINMATKAQINTFCSQGCKHDMAINRTWKTLNMVDRLNLSDTDERAKVMPRSRTMSLGGVQNILLKGLTIGPN